MDSSGSNRTGMFEIYTRYCDIVLQNECGSSKDALAVLLKSLEMRRHMSDAIFEDLFKLLSRLHLSVDSHQFTRFYDFVFFVCCENGQKNITVNRAIIAWRLVLTGRFRLLNHWCDFVEKQQRHNISEDTWQQLLAFSRCVNEDLEGYDPKGAWPVLLDDFVDHMYRTSPSSNCSTRDFCCNCGSMEHESSISNSLSGLKLLPGSKRKSFIDNVGLEEKSCREYSTISDHFMKSKRLRQNSVANKFGSWESDLATSVFSNATDHHIDTNIQNSFGGLNNSACAAEDNLSKGFEGHLSLGRCFQIDHKSSVSST